MLNFFRSYKNIVIVVIILTGIMTWAHVLGKSETADFGKYGTFLYELLANVSSFQVWLSFILFLVIAVMLVFFNTRMSLIGKITYLPALCYVLLIGGVPEVHLFNPAIIAAIFFIAGFILLAKSFESEQLSYSFFTVSAIISLSTFFYQYMYVYMLIVWLILAFWRPGYWREWIFSILGFAFPVFLAFSWFFLIEDDPARMGTFFQEIFNINREIPELSTSTNFFFTFSIVLAVIIFGYTLRFIGSKKTAIRTVYYILILTAIITAGMIFIIPDMLPLAWYLLAFPISFIFSIYLANVRSLRWGTIILAIFFAGVIISHVIYFY